MAESVEIRITASNGASQVFRAIQQDADRLGTGLKEAGRDGDKAFDDIERGAREASREMQNAERSARSMGDRIQGAADTIDGMAAGLTALGASLVYSGQQAMNKERQIIALRNAYGEAADEMLQFAEELDNLTIFSDDDIREGERFFATLRNNYGLTIEEIQRLMTITADLASASNISYADAANRVTAAIRGEAEAAEYLGLTLNQQAIDRENLTLTMSNEEAARFRLNALYEQAAVYEGTAADMAASSVGTYAELTDTLQDAAAAAGEFIGPWGSIVSGLGLGLAGVTSMVGGMGRMVTALRNSTLAASALTVMMNPLVLGFAAATAAAVTWYQSLDEGETILDRFESTMDDLVDMDGQGFFENLYGAVKTFVIGVDDAVFSVKDLESVLDDLQEMAEAHNNSNLAAAESQFRSIEAMNDRYLAGEQLINGMTLEQRAQEHAAATGEDYEAVLRQITDAYQTDESERLSYLQAQKEIGEAFLDESVDADALMQRLTELHNLYTTGAITHDQYKSSIVGIAENLDDFRTDVEDTVTSVQRLNDVFRDGSEGPAMPGFEYELPTYGPALEELEEARERADEARQALADLARDGFGAGEDAVIDFAEAVRASMEDIDALGNAMGAGGKELFRDAIEEAAELREHMADLGESGTDALAEIAEEARQAREEFIASGMALAGWDNALSQINFTSLATDSSLLAENLIRSGAALDTVFRAIVTNTNAIASQVEGVENWALELIGVAGEYAAIDDLLADGLITIEQYNAAQQAQVEISRANASVQEDILAIQAMQAPFIAEMTAAQAAYVDELRQAPEEQQRLALAWMDTNTAAQAHEGILLANSVAMGEWGRNGEVAFEGFIRGAVQANPLLFDIWESVGLISGTPMDFTVNTEGLEGAQSEMSMLIDSIDHLTQVLAQIFGIEIEVEGQEEVEQIIGLIEDITGRRHDVTVDADTGDAQHQMQGVIDYLTEMDGATGTVTAVGVDDASDELSAVDALRSMVDGTTATVTNIGIDDASDEINTVAGALAGLDGNTATVTINAIDNAGGVIGSVASALFNLDGRTATSYVDTVYRTIGASPFMNGGTVWADDPAPVGRFGVIPQAANGRTVMVGEAGPEMVTLPNGSMVMPHAASMSRTGGGGDRPIQINVPIYGNVYGLEDLEERVAKALSPVLRELAFDVYGSQVNV